LVSQGATSGSEGYLNVYLHSASGKSNFFDCRLDFLIPSTVGTGTLVVTKDTVAGNVDNGNSGDGDLGCDGATTLNEYITAYSGAVLGAGDSTQFYSFSLDTGSTTQDNDGLEVCWSNVAITTTTGTTNYVFAELTTPPTYRRRQLEY